jgi:hypothetical protein
MREGSVSVRPGQRVAAGDLLGLVGLSGKSEFPHLHFEVRRGNAIIDPFTGARAPGACGGRRAPLWTPAAHAALAYDPTGLLRAGFADRAINMEAVEAGRFRALRLPRSAPALVFWTLVFGVQRGDEEHIRFIGPDGALFAEYKGTVPKTQAQRFRFVGKRSRGKPWPAGRYRGTYRLARGKPGARAPVIEHSVVLEVD